MRGIMDNEGEHKSSRKKYKSPKSKLIKFFENSRDKWKKKAKDAKYQIKLLRKKIKYIEQKKKEYKKHSNNLEMQLQQMKDKEKRMQDEIDRLKKKFKSASR
jgi:chromosome segregation ATPase